MGLADARVVVAEGDEGDLEVSVEGEGTSALVGRGGETIDALQYLLAQIASRAEGGARRRVSLDADGYRARREAALVELAEQAAQEAVEHGDEIELDAMTPARPAHRPHGPEGPTGDRDPQRGRGAPPADHRRAGRVIGAPPVSRETEGPAPRLVARARAMGVDLRPGGRRGAAGPPRPHRDRAPEPHRDRRDWTRGSTGTCSTAWPA